MTRPTKTPDMPAPMEVWPWQMFKAFGVPRSTFMAALERGDTTIPQPQGASFGGKSRRWTAEQLPEIVRALKDRRLPVPPGWDVDEAEKTSGKKGRK